MTRTYLISLLSLFGLLSIASEVAAQTPITARSLYAVNQSADERGFISVYDIEAGHRRVRTIKTVPNVGEVRGVAASAVSGRLYVAYQDVSGAGRVYCLNVYDDTVAWDRAISPGVDRLRLLYVPTW